MLAPINRFSLRFNRLRLEKEGKTLRSPLFTFIYSFNSDLSSPRFAFLVSKKSFKTSVSRHKVKRILANILRQNLSDFSNNLEVIIIPSSRVATVLPEELSESLLSILKTLK